jgi:hypothetical protein
LLHVPPKGFADAGEGKTPIRYKFVSSGYFDVLDIAVVRGRAFTAAERENFPVAIVSESMATTLWHGGNAVGETLRIEPDATDRPKDQAPMPARLVTVVGVAKDVRGFRFAEIKGPDVFLPGSLDVPGTALVARVSGDPDLARQVLTDRLTRIDPNMGTIMAMRSVARLETYLLQVAFWISIVLGGLALLLTMSGLFSVLSYLVAQRTKEIGVRIALGASSQSVTGLMLAQTTRPVIYGLLGGAGLAAAIATALLAMPFGGFISEIVQVADPVAYAASLAVIVAACLLAAAIPATRAARVDPMTTLRQD